MNLFIHETCPVQNWKSVFLFLKILVSLVLSRHFGNIIHDIAQNYMHINVNDLWKLEKLQIKRNKAQLDINFLITCKNFGVFSKIINVYLLNVDEKDMSGIKKKLQKNAIHKRIWERNDIDKKIKNVELQIKHKLYNFDWYILVKILKPNVKNKENAVLKTHQKKIRNLTTNSTNLFTHSCKKFIQKFIQNIQLMKNWISSNLAYTTLYHHQEFIKPTFLSHSKWCNVFSLKI